MTVPNQPNQPNETREQAGDTGDTVEWLELFFDLVVVAAVAVLTDGLREHPNRRCRAKACPGVNHG
jgi:low temperature requirement protein LtrA